MTAKLDPLRREAVAWVQRLTSGEATPADAEALKRWCAQSPAHAEAYAEASRVWNDLGQATLLHGRGGGSLLELRQVLLRRQALTRRVLLGGGIAAAGAYVAVRPPFGLWPSLSELRADFRTATGEQRRVTLTDNVSVTMNTQTSIALDPAQGEADRIELIAGEAAFTTAPDAKRPLVVVAASGQSRGSAAQFNVRCLPAAGAVRVTCTSGDVRIEQRGAAATINAGQQVRYDARGLSAIETIEPDIVSAWQRGIVVFRATPLADVVEEINRYRPGRIILINAELGRKLVSGRFRTDQVDSILTRLEQAFDARIRRLPGGIVLMS
jgi:transmembrane sensor